MLTLLEGPAGAGKSQHAAAMIRAGEADAVADVTSLHVALRALERDPDSGLYPVREADDPALALALYMQAVAVREGLRQRKRMIVTTSRREQAPRWQAVAAETDTPLVVRTIDPGRAAAAARLAEATGGVLSSSCESALNRWY